MIARLKELREAEKTAKSRIEVQNAQNATKEAAHKALDDMLALVDSLDAFLNTTFFDTATYVAQVKDLELKLKRLK